MRRNHLVIYISALLLLTFLLRKVGVLLALLIDNGSADAIDPLELLGPDPTQSPPLQGTQLIPKVIHQTYVNTSVPDAWKAAQQSCRDRHPDYQYRFWTDESSRAFIEDKYRWFLATFDNYPHNIQRADAIRYFILDHYGGIYIDLDQGCRRRLDSLLQYPAFLRLAAPTGVSNDVMGATPGHPFFRSVTERIKEYDRNWMLPYVTVMASTGPLFLSLMWKKYLREKTAVEEREEEWEVRLLTRDEFNGMEESLFESYGGSSWHEGDARMFLWMGKHIFTVIVAVSVVVTVLGFGAWWVRDRVAQMRERSKCQHH